MIRDLIKKELEKLIEQTGKYTGFEVEVFRTSDPKNGDFSTNAALKLSHQVKQSPLAFAKKLTDSLKNQPYIEKLEVANPGFINFFIKDSFWQEQVSDVLNQGKKYGSNSLGKGKKARVEFVSANPTGPLHFGNARGGPIGDCLASVLEFSSYSVLREYYHNDIGGQVEKLGESIVNAAAGGKLDDQEYKGEYITDLAKEIGKVISPAEAGKKAVDILLKQALADSGDLGIKFDDVYSESELLETSKTKNVVGELEEKGFLKKKDGALWFAPNDEFLKDRETVVVKGDGKYTYFANDIAYHDLKFADGPDLVIDVFGANHHGHVPRLQAAISALGYDEKKFHVILYQWVRFKRGGELVKMSKRSGTFVTAREVIDEVGRDAVRFMVLSHDANSHIDFDLDLAREQSSKNPVYYVQYAHARICSVLEKLKSGPVSTSSRSLGHSLDRDQQSDIRLHKAHRSQNLEITHSRAPSLRDIYAARFELLSSDYELNLIKQITRFPELVEDISKNFAVNQLTTYARGLADSFHLFYENCRVIGEKKELEEARIGLISATRIALQNTLMLLGISAPEKM